MKKILMMAILSFSGFVFNPSALAEEKQGQEGQIIETETSGTLRGILFRVWGKLKSINPTQKQSANRDQVYTAGIRGAESTDSLLKLYWKDDLSQDAVFQAELQQFDQAQRKLDQGDFESAIKAFDQFLAAYGGSRLRPNALLSRGIGLAAAGDSRQSITSMQLFVDENPNHPLVDDAKQVIRELSL